QSLIGFAGARVAAGTTGDALPDGFQRAEFLHAHGFVDQVVPRLELRNRLAALLAYLRPAELPTDDEGGAINSRVMRSLALIDSFTEGNGKPREEAEIRG